MTAALRQLSANELDEITKLDVRAGGQREGILDDVCEKVLWTDNRGGGNEPSLRETSIANTAGYLAPPKSCHRMSEFVLISAAWEPCRPQQAESVSWDELSGATGQALQLAYASAVRNLVAWAEQA